MSSPDSRQEVPLSDMRGVTSFEYNGKSVFVKADVEAVSAALAKHRRASLRKTDIAGKPVELAKQCFFVFRFAGHTWSQIIGRDPFLDSEDGANPFAGGFDVEKLNAIVATHLNEDDAKAISSELKTTALYYFIGDTSFAIGYSLFESGELVEKLDAGEAYDEEGNDLEPSFSWYSKTGESGPADARAAMSRAEALFKRLDALEPGLNFQWLVGYVMHRPGDEVTVSNQRGDFERIDFVVI